MRSRVLTTLLFLVTLPAAAVTPQDAWLPIKARMDKAASEFKTMTAGATYMTHTDVIDENSTETATVAMKKVQAGEVQGLIDFLTPPDKRTLQFENHKVRIYQPKIKTVQEWDLGKYGEQLDQFLMIGFGTSGTALARDYEVSVLGPERVKGQEAKYIRLRLVPKSEEARQRIKQLDLWIPEKGDPYPVQEKISQPSGDYQVITYAPSDLKVNEPLRPDALQLKLPPGVKTEYPGK